DPRPLRTGRRRLSGAVPRRRRVVTRPVLRGAAVPALVRVDARRRQRPGLRTCRPPDPGRARATAGREARRARIGGGLVTEGLLLGTGRVATPVARGGPDPGRPAGYDSTGGVPYVWKLSIVFTPQAWPLARSDCVQTTVGSSGS